MPNVNRASGLRVTKYRGSTISGQLTRVFVPSSDATPIAVGDIVKLTGAGDTTGIPVVSRLAANTDTPYGVVVGFEVDSTNLNTPQIRAASTNRYMMVVADQDTVFEVQASGATVVGTDVGLNVGVTFTASNAVTGASNMLADMATKAVTATLPLKIVGVAQLIEQDFADTTNVKILVKFANHAFANAVAGI
jgi:hypothetical protein